MIAVDGVNHVTLCCSVAQLPGVEAFYRDVLGLRVGARPAFDFAGTWLYAGDEAVIHLAATCPQPAGAARPDASSPAVVPGAAVSTGPIDHFALRVTGTLHAWRDRLAARGIRFSEAPVPGFPLYQLFLHDPLGVRIELNLELAR
jgi:catechol 2,3-dioxygenase-like lactoylglutathione lyase family enzyme